MGACLTALGVSEPKLTLRPKKIVMGVVFGTHFTLAYFFNILLFIFACLMIALLSLGFIPAVKQGFYCGDPSISHPYRQETITPWILGITAISLPTFMVFLTEFLANQSIKNINYHRAVFYLTEVLIGMIVTLLITSICKVLTGEHRPHFLYTCRPDAAENCTTGEFIQDFLCTNELDSVFNRNDVFLSFPSGHSSISWFVGIFTAYVIHSKLTTVNVGYAMKLFLISICLTWSLLCSLSRIIDRRHHWWDVLAGSLMGIGFAFYSIRVVREKLRDNNPLICSICLERRISIAVNGNRQSYNNTLVNNA